MCSVGHLKGSMYLVNARLVVRNGPMPVGGNTEHETIYIYIYIYIRQMPGLCPEPHPRLATHHHQHHHHHHRHHEALIEDLQCM